MGIPFDRNNTAAPKYPKPLVGEQVRVFIGQGENATSSAGNKMLVLSCVVTDNQEGAGFEFKEYLTEGRYFNYKAACIMNAAGIDIDTIDEVDDMTFRGFDAAVVFKTDTFISKKDGKEKESIKADLWVPRSEATIELSPDPKSPAVAVQTPTPDGEAKYKDKLPFE